LASAASGGTLGAVTSGTLGATTGTLTSTLGGTLGESHDSEELSKAKGSSEGKGKEDD
jgi:hypothetical protein